MLTSPKLRVTWTLINNQQTGHIHYVHMTGPKLRVTWTFNELVTCTYWDMFT